MGSVGVWQHRLTVALPLFLSLAIAASASAQDRARTEIVPNIPHSFTIISVAFSPDGTRLLSGSFDKSLKLWAATTGQLIRTFGGKSGFVFSVAFSPDGARLLSGSEDTTLNLWDAASGQLIRTFEGHSDGVTSVAFSPDGTRLLSGSHDGMLKLWDAASGQLIHTFEGHSASVWSVAFSPDGTRLLSGSWDKTLKLWDIGSGRLIRTFEGHSDRVRSATFSPDGTRLLSGSDDGTIKLWDAANGQLIRTFEGHSSSVTSVAFSPDGTRLLSGSWDKTLKLWDAADSGQLIRTFEGHVDEVWSVAFSSDGTRLVSGSGDKTLKLWAASGQLIRTFQGGAESVHLAAFSPDGTRLISGGDDKTLKLWDAANGQLIRTFEGHSESVSSVAFSPDGARLLSGSWDKTLKLWDVATGALILTLEGHLGKVFSVAFSPDGTRLLSGSVDKKLRLWDATSGQLIRAFEGHAASVNSIAFSPDGVRLLSGSDDGTLKLWDAASGRLISTFEEHSGRVFSVAFSPDGTRLLSGSWDTTLKLWDSASGQLIRTFEGRSGWVISVAFSPDGTRLLSGSDDRMLKLWDAATGQLIRSFEGHSGFVSSVTFSPDGTRLLSGSWDGTVRIWNAATGQVLASLFGSRDGHWLAITPAGFFAASEKGSEMLGVVRGLQAYSVMQFYDHLYRHDLVEESLKGDPEHRHENARKKIDLQKILNSGPAPQIKFLLDRTEGTDSTKRLTVSLVSTGGGIGSKVVWRVNGVAQGATTAPPPAVIKGLGDRLATETFRLSPNQHNVIEVVAYNAAGLLATPPLRTVIDKFGVSTGERSRMHILALGVSKYARKDWTLQYAAKDAQAFGERMKLVAEGLYREVKVTTLVDEQVTMAGIDREMKRISSEAGADDVFILFLAGHGRNDEGTYYYLPQDLNFEGGRTLRSHGIGMENWNAWLKAMPATKSILIIDTCDSAAASGLARGSTERDTAINRLKEATGRSVITAARQAAYEGYNGHGVLTYAVLDALTRPENSAEEEVTLARLSDHVYREVPRITQELFGIRQLPDTTIRNNFPIGMRRVATLWPGVAPAIPTSPTHVNIELLKVFKEPGGKGGVVHQLPPFTTVALIKTDRGWAHIARDGKALGYVPEAKLKRLN